MEFLDQRRNRVNENSSQQSKITVNKTMCRIPNPTALGTSEQDGKIKLVILLLH